MGSSRTRTQIHLSDCPGVDEVLGSSSGFRLSSTRVPGPVTSGLQPQAGLTVLICKVGVCANGNSEGLTTQAVKTLALGLAHSRCPIM